MMYHFMGQSLTDTEVGIEIEVEAGDVLDPVGGHWDYKHDGSLRGEYTAEYVTRPGFREGDVRQALSHLAGSLSDSDLKISPRCGTHVHVDIQRLSLEEMTKVLCLYYVLEPLLLRICGEDREMSPFCIPLAMSAWQVEWLTRFRSTGIMQVVENDAVKYAALNLACIWRFGSIEFRGLQTPDNLCEVETWVHIMLAIKEQGMQADNPADFITDISALGPEGFLRKYLGDELAAYIMNYQVDTYGLLMVGVRSVQQACYTPFMADRNKANLERVVHRRRRKGQSRLQRQEEAPQPRPRLRQPETPRQMQRRLEQERQSLMADLTQQPVVSSTDMSNMFVESSNRTAEE